MAVIDLKTKYSLNGEIKVIVENIQEIIVVSIKDYYKVQVTLASGRTYFLADDDGKDFFFGKTDAEAVRDAFISSLS